MIVNAKGYKVYEMKQKVSSEQEIPARQEEKQKIEPKQEIPVRQEEKKDGMGMQMLILYKELERTGVSLETVLARYQLQNLEQMTEDIYTKALRSLKRTKAKQAA